MSATPILDLLTVLDPNQPLSLGQVRLNKDGVLELNSAAPPLQNSQFIWAGFPVRVSLHKSQENQTICDIVADLGTLPFSIQSPELRNILLAVMKGFRPPEDCKLMIGPRSAIWACQQTTLQLPLAPAAILAEITVFLHAMNPIILLIRDLRAAYDGRQPGGKALKTPN